MIVGIIGGIAVPSVIGLIEKSREEVCYANRLQMERMYKMHLVLANTEHSDQLFTQYLLENWEEICPENGDVSYVDGVVHCSIHPKNQDGSDDKGEGPGVPFF